MEITKNCVQCGAELSKPYTESRKRWEARKFCSLQCKADSQKGKPSGIKGKKFPSKAQYLSCRFCGELTKRSGTKDGPNYGKVRCDKPECIEAARKLKNMRIAATTRAKIDNGTKRVSQRGWKGVARISPEEIAISPWLESLGWEPQYKVLTGVHSFRLPRYFRLDFALPDCKLYIEIDGSVHKHKDRRVRDERRNQMLANMDWQGLRIPSIQIRNDIEAVKRTIATWLTEQIASLHNHETTSMNI